jgi:hypothetical protein
MDNVDRHPLVALLRQHRQRAQADYGPWFDNHRRLRELVAELEDDGD